MASRRRLLKVDRSAPFSFEKVGADPLAEFHSVASEDPAALSISTIDMAKVKLVPILDVVNSKPCQINETIMKNLAELREQGYILLDAKVAEALLLNPEYIPEEWREITNVDQLSEKTGTIRFDGTVFNALLRDQPTVLAPAFDRGRWEVGVASFVYPEEYARLCERAYVTMKVYSVVMER